ncbi:TIR domain-containing protein [Vibrio splendidus]
MSKQFNQIYFVWHPKDDDIVKPYFEYTVKSLSRNLLKPMSRSINFPIFFRTSTNSKYIPKEIDHEAGNSIVICFSSKWVTGNEKWLDYYNSLLSENSIVIPVALDPRYSFNLNKPLSEANFIRSYDFSHETKTLEFLVSIIQTILKKISDSPSGRGDDVTTKLFLSHAKKDVWATEIARSLKSTIDNTSLNSFFDATNIHAAFTFSEEIQNGISDSTVISIQSDNYSSRYWCQKEIQTAKEKNVPIVVVCSLKDGEDRIFPYSANVPSIYIDSNNQLSNTNAYRILEHALLETLKILSQHNRTIEYDADNVHILFRPPEPYDLKCISRSSTTIQSIIYPDPPVYEFETQLFNDFGIEVVTPLTFRKTDLSEVKLGVSISEPDILEMHHLGISNTYLQQVSQSLAQHTLFKRGSLVYGGDLRPTGFTEFIFDEALIVQDRMRTSNVKVFNYLAWPIYLQNEEQLCEWKSTYQDIAKFELVPAPSEADKLVDTDEFLPPNSIPNKILWSRSLTNMRERLVENTDARVCIGGRLSGYKGCCPGVLEEILISIEANQPVFLLGAFGGAVSRVCKLIETNETCEEFTLEWQSKFNKDYSEVIDTIGFDWSEVVEKLRAINLNTLSSMNGLTSEQNFQLMKTLDVNVALDLIFLGLGNLNEK